MKQLIARGPNSSVYLDAACSRITKKFSASDPHEAARLARHEFDYLERFSAVLAAHPFLDCPEPISAVPDKGIVRMTYCPGVRLDYALSLQDPEVLMYLDHIAEQLATAIVEFVTVFDEPYYDLATHNVLYDAETARVSMVDFTSRRRKEVPWASQRAMENSLGGFIGVSLYWTVRPLTCANRGYWRALAKLTTAIVGMLKSERQLCLSVMREVAQSAFDFTAKQGRLRRRLWYSTVGQALFSSRSAAIYSACS